MRATEQSVQGCGQALAALLDLDQCEALAGDFALHAQHRLLRQQAQLVACEADVFQPLQQREGRVAVGELPIGGVIAQPQRLDPCRQLDPRDVLQGIGLRRLRHRGLHRQLALAPAGQGLRDAITRLAHLAGQQGRRAIVHGVGGVHQLQFESGVRQSARGRRALMRGGSFGAGGSEAGIALAGKLDQGQGAGAERGHGGRVLAKSARATKADGEDQGERRAASEVIGKRGQTRFHGEQGRQV